MTKLIVPNKPTTFQMPYVLLDIQRCLDVSYINLVQLIVTTHVLPMKHLLVCRMCLMSNCFQIVKM